MLADIEGTQIFYEVDGEGPPLFILHGGLGLDHTLYRKTLGRFGEQFQLVFMDHRGNGRSGRPPLETITMAQLATDIFALADHLRIEQFAVLGHSYGGDIAQEMACTQPTRLSHLVLVCTNAGIRGATEQPWEHLETRRPLHLEQI